MLQGLRLTLLYSKRNHSGRRNLKGGKKVDFFDTSLFVVSAEDLLLSKLIWIQQIQSTVQIDDIKNLALIESLDWPYIHTWLDLLK